MAKLPLTNPSSRADCKLRTYSTDREDEVSKIFIIFLLCLTGSGTISITRNGFKFLTHLESKTSQFEIVVK